MQLTKLEIKGFKSFGDRILIHFDAGITGIVGPNGCGKSNVVDAIRWVLGEQKSRMLRSDKMENIIFNGTKKRKASQMAEVSLTFDNTKNILPTEYSQITITRRYYRSGESEYLLNGVTCRLKDITNLFLDTGIASNSYAIIELKMVDDILNDKDNSRRALFEEAAGISKFKIRKKETLRKLGDTDADLDRVEDLLFEIDKNLKSLEKQAKQAERYFKTKEEYKVLSVQLARLSIGKKRENFQSLERRIQEENDRKITLNKQIAEKEALIEQAKSELINKEKLLSNRQRSLNEHVAKIRQYESEKKIKNERLGFLTSKSDSLKGELALDKKSNERAAFSIQGLEQEKNAAKKLLAEAESQVQELKVQYEEQKGVTQKIQSQLQELRQQLKSRQEQVFQINKSVEIKEIQLSTFKQELEKTASDTTEQSANLEDFDQKEKEFLDELKHKQREMDGLIQHENTLKEKVSNTEKTIEIIKDELTQVSRKLDARQNEYNLTKSLVDNLEGFPEAIKFLRKQADWGKNAPLLSDLITCDEEYRVSIENFLEPYMNYYIVEYEAQAYEAVNLLSNASKGKAHFFNLDAFDHFHPSDDQIIDSALPASEIVEYDSKYRKLVSYLLDGVYIWEGDINSIPANAKATFISKNGKVIRRKYSISGGSVGLFEGKRIGRAKNLEKLSKQIKELDKRIQDIKQSLFEKQRDLERLKNSSKAEELEEVRKEHALLNQEYISIKTKREQLSEMLSNNATKREDIQDKIQELSEDISVQKPKAAELQSSLQSMEDQAVELGESLAIENENLSQRSYQYNEKNIAFHQQENKVNSLEQELNYKRSTFESSKERIEKNQLELQRNEAEIKQLIEKAEVNDDELIAFYEEKDSIEQGVHEAEKDYYASRGHIDGSEKEVRELLRSKEQLDTLLMELQSAMSENKLQLSSLKERLSVEFNVDLDKIMKEEETDEEIQESEEALKEKVQKIKSRLEGMGPINPMAMEAYEEIKERHEFITGQKEDLIKAKESLMETIGEIDAVAKTTFLEAFENIKENFIKVFRSLFTEEDDCDLKLTNPEDPLESGIDIIAKPKGKRPLTINQLSGGEKTLTATSLLFAIYLLKPAPFCIFDEVDAPLDDANIDKFNTIIKTFSKDSQFIIVTHNKRTMSSTDVIYGITMVEQGVSKVVPVDLREIA